MPINGLRFILLSLFISGCQSISSQQNQVPIEQYGKFEANGGQYKQDTLELTEWNQHTNYHDFLQCSHSAEQPFDQTPFWVAPETVWQSITTGYQLNDRIHPRIDAEFDWYARHPEYIARVSQRAERYVYYVAEEVRRRGLPMELALLPIVESAFDPFAYSHGRASGMWQFIPGTAKEFELKSNWWYDGRRDVIESTDAALSYLEQLNQAFDGDWLLALAAYNSGQGTVNKAIRKNRKKKKSIDFWSLDLPKETRSYVPKLLAIAKLIDNPRRYGMALYPVNNDAYFDIVETGSQIDLSQAAELSEIDIEEIYKLNPGFNRWATDPKGPHRLLIPVDKSLLFREKITQLDQQERVHWERYSVKNGDSLLLLAKRFNTDAAVIRDINKIKGNMIRIGQKLMIPVATQKSSLYSYSATQRQKNIQKKRKGKEGSQQTFHTVAEGESLWTIARKYHVTTTKIAHWNGIAPRDLIRPGQKLSVWLPPKLASANTEELPQPLNHPREGIVKKLGYTVRNGDSLARIAQKFNIRVNDILSWNTINTKYIQPGQKLTLFVNVMH